VLELIRLKQILVTQSDEFGDIDISPAPPVREFSADSEQPAVEVGAARPETTPVPAIP